MEFELHPASVNDKSILRHLLELAHHDYSEYNGDDVDEHGLFGYNYLDNYWTEPGRHAFLIKVSDKLAGFVLVRLAVAHDEFTANSIAEFFVMHKYRRQEIGKRAAWRIFDMFPGQWDVEQEEGNLPAQNFWRQTITEYTQGDFTDAFLLNGEWRRRRQRFVSRTRVSDS